MVKLKLTGQVRWISVLYFLQANFKERRQSIDDKSILHR